MPVSYKYNTAKKMRAMRQWQKQYDKEQEMENFEKKYKKWHGYWSFVKSAIRIVGCLGVIYAGWDLMHLASLLSIAELIGIIEEWI